MKKIALATILSLASAFAFAGSAAFEVQDIQGKNGLPDQRAGILSVKENVSKSVIGDLTFVNVKNNDSETISYRVEGGATGLMPMGAFTGFARVAVGQRFSGTANYSYYSVEPGVKAPVGPGLTASVSYRYRDAFENKNGDQTRTVRVGLNYDLTPKDVIGIAYMQGRGDARQNIIGVNYARNF